MQAAFEIAQAVLLSIGGGGVIVFALSSFISKIWADRILRTEKAEIDKTYAQFKTDLDSLAAKKSLDYQQKLDLYKIVTTPLIDIVVQLNEPEKLTKEHLKEFDGKRLYVTAQLALFAPQTVFNSFNEMVDYIYNSIEDGTYTFSDLRIKALSFVSEMRKDIGIYQDDLSYHGNR